MEKPFDIAIIGGGIVGMATAWSLTRRRRLRMIVLEAASRLAAHQTGHNSGVVHSGLYYRPGSLKARNCVRGREMLYQFCADRGIPCERCGKVVVATDDGELVALERLYRRGQANGLHGVRRLTASELREHEPHVEGIAGLLVPETGIVDFVGVTEALGAECRELDADIRLGWQFVTARAVDRGLVLATTRGEVHCRSLINCAGLHSDRVARRCGVHVDCQILPFRGEYYALRPHAWGLVRNLIYPVPDPRYPFLGVHMTRMALGGVEAGPNAVLAWAREGYRKSTVSAADLAEMLRFPGFWQMARRHWLTGVHEWRRSLSRRQFLRALQRLVPELTAGDIVAAPAGVRAMAVTPQGDMLDDFCIAHAPRMIHVLNAPSPAATACLSIGRTLADLAERRFDLA